MEFIQIKTEGSVGTITLDQPKKHNALSAPLIRSLIYGVQHFIASSVRVVILRAPPGAKVWSAGHDIDELPEGGRDPLGWGDPLRELVRTIEGCPAPVIAMVEGGVWGGAVEVVMACDIVLAAPSATFAVTPAKLGVPYNISGMMTFMSAASIRVVKELAFTAQPISAERAERVGMVNQVVPADQLEGVTLAMAATISANAPLSIMSMKEELRVLAGAKPLSPRGFEKIQGLRRTVYDSNDYAEGLRAFKEKRKPVFTGK
jgi:methylmalonyl-CoA decarboxylase